MGSKYISWQLSALIMIRHHTNNVKICYGHIISIGVLLAFKGIESFREF